MTADEQEVVIDGEAFAGALSGQTSSVRVGSAAAAVSAQASEMNIAESIR